MYEGILSYLVPLPTHVKGANPDPTYLPFYIDGFGFGLGLKCLGAVWDAGGYGDRHMGYSGTQR